MLIYFLKPTHVLYSHYRFIIESLLNFRPSQHFISSTVVYVSLFFAFFFIMLFLYFRYLSLNPEALLRYWKQMDLILMIWFSWCDSLDQSSSQKKHRSVLLSCCCFNDRLSCQSQLYKRVCPSGGGSVCFSVRRPNRPSLNISFLQRDEPAIFWPCPCDEPLIHSVIGLHFTTILWPFFFLSW